MGTGNKETAHMESLIEKASTEVLLDTDVPMEIMLMRVAGLQRLSWILKNYSRDMSGVLVNIVCMEKIEHIKRAASKREIEEILKPSIPVYKNNDTWVGKIKYHCEAEELIGWGTVSPHVNLAHYAQERILELAKKYFPEDMLEVEKRIHRSFLPKPPKENKEDDELYEEEA